VIGFLSQVHIAPDRSIEPFILEPDGTSGAADTKPDSPWIHTTHLSR
jgi:hypothetical protein